MAGGSPPAEVDISVDPDVLLTAISVTTVVPEKWMESLQEPMPAKERLEYRIQATALIWEPLEQWLTRLLCRPVIMNGLNRTMRMNMEVFF